LGILYFNNNRELITKY